MREERRFTRALRDSWLPVTSDSREVSFFLRLQNHWLEGVVWMGRAEEVLGPRERDWSAGRREVVGEVVRAGAVEE
jgi:hypothetical protein